MNILDISNTFIARSGRLDLSTTDITLLVNEACKLLDTMENSGKRSYRYFFDLSVDDGVIDIPVDLRVLHKVYLHTASDSWLLTKVDSAAIRYAYRNEIEAYIYDVLPKSLGSQTIDSALKTILNVETVLTAPTDRGFYLVIYPKASEASVVEIESLNYAVELDGVTNSSNYWTLRQPSLVLQAMNYLTVKDLLNIDESTKIYKDLRAQVSEIIYDFYETEQINQMEG